MSNDNNVDNSKGNMPHIGEMLNLFIAQRRKSPSAFSRKLGIDVSALLRIRKKSSIQIQLLWNICQTQQHNFIADIALQLPSEYTGALQDALVEKDKEIAALHSIIERITSERELYKELLKK